MKNGLNSKENLNSKCTKDFWFYFFFLHFFFFLNTMKTHKFGWKQNSCWQMHRMFPHNSGKKCILINSPLFGRLEYAKKKNLLEVTPRDIIMSYRGKKMYFCIYNIFLGKNPKTNQPYFFLFFLLFQVTVNLYWSSCKKDSV